MNLSEIVDKIIELQQQGASPEGRVAEYLESTLRATGAQVELQPFHFSTQTHAVVSGAVFLLSILFIFGIVKRRHRAAFFSALAISLVLVLELSLDFHVISWPALEKANNIVVHFPVQDAARVVVVGTHYGQAGVPVSGPFVETVSAFLFPMTLVMALLGLWQLAMHFGKLTFEDAHTITLIMGIVCSLYYALWFVTLSHEGSHFPEDPHAEQNAGSMAVLAGLSQDLSQKYPRLQNTWVTVAFFGGTGSSGHGARQFARAFSRERGRGLPMQFIGCEQLGRGEIHACMIPGNTSADSLYTDRELVRILNRAALAVTGFQLHTITKGGVNSRGFVEFGHPTIAITTMPQEERHVDGGRTDPHAIQRGQLILSLQLIEKALLELDKVRLR